MVWWWWSFSLFARMFGEWPFMPCLHFFFFLEVEISSRTLIPLFMPGSVHSGSASWDDCGQMFLDKLRVSSFLERFPHYAWTVTYSAHSDFVGSRVCACLGVTCHLHFWLRDQGLLHATAVTHFYYSHVPYTQQTPNHAQKENRRSHQHTFWRQPNYDQSWNQSTVPQNCTFTRIGFNKYF